MNPLALLLALALAGSGAAQDYNPPLNHTKTPDRPDPPVTTAPQGTVPEEVVDLTPGDRAPDFQLDSSLGTPVRLADLRGHWSVLVFDDDGAGISAMGALDDSVKALGASVYGVCREGPAALRSRAERGGIRFPLLADLTGQVSELFGMYDDDDLAIQPGLVILDAKGVVRMVVQGPSLHSADVLQMARHTIRGA